MFAGKGRCIGCHTGFAFTDHNFYDIGLPGADKGRGKEIDLRAADYAFKTPTLRELAWTAPYMHDGSLATLEDVISHYEKGGMQRRTRSRDLPRNLKLTQQERADLIAFLAVPLQRRAASAIGGTLGRVRPARAFAAPQGHHRGEPGQQAVRARLVFAWAWGRR